MSCAVLVWHGRCWVMTDQKDSDGAVGYLNCQISAEVGVRPANSILYELPEGIFHVVQVVLQVPKDALCCRVRYIAIA